MRLLRPVTDLLKEWLKDRAERSITVELGADKIELKGSSRDEQHRLIGEFIFERILICSRLENRAWRIGNVR
jgi:hypothetical protein